MGLLTGNLREGAQIKLQHFGLERYFSFGGFGDVHPDRDDVAQSALDAARAALDGQSGDEQIWVFGDTPLDIRCARAIGARVLAVNTGVDSRDELERACPDVLLDDLSDTQQVLEIVEGQ
jgi:phosphoglycolate phosphatase-like HAD superfamily hydrolase